MISPFIYKIVIKNVSGAEASAGEYIRNSPNTNIFNASNDNYIHIEDAYYNPSISTPGYYIFSASLNIDTFYISFNLIDVDYFTPFPESISIQYFYKNKNLIKGDGGNGKLIGKSFIRKVILTGGAGGAGGGGFGSLMNGTYIRNKENEDFIQIEHPNYSIVFFMGFWYLLENGTEVCVSSDLINWQNSSGEVLTPPIGQIFYKP